MLKMSFFKRDKKEEEDLSGNPFHNLDKTIVLQDVRYFNQCSVNPRKCIHILTNILYLLNQGEQLSTQEATEVFFAITKLFQTKDVMLRRMMYLCMIELSSLAQDVIIVTSSLTKDMTGNQVLYRAAAIRALCSITDTSMLQAIERYMKQAILDKNTSVSSAALVSALHLSGREPELIKRWANEAQEAMTSDNAMVAYHALGVVAAARRNDKLSTVKLVLKTTQTTMKSPYALCLLIRLAARLVVYDEFDDEPYIEFIKQCLTHKSEMVIYEAARALVTLKLNSRDQEQAVSVLKLFCGSTKASLRLAGVRTLSLLSDRWPSIVRSCYLDNLISDSNRSIATVAVTTLLAASTESTIDILLKQISSFISEISDEFKIFVVREIKKLCTKFPWKHHCLAQFLSAMLRAEGGLEYKAATADAIIALVESYPEAKETGLTHLCEFMEDCEHAVLTVRILHLLGREGPKSPQPARFIRFIYNRIILELGPVRAAAVSAVAQFGAQRPELLPNIRVLLQRCQLDEEDEVRDRAVYYSAILDSGDPQLINDYIINVPKPNLVELERALRDHLATKPAEPFDYLTVPCDEPRQQFKPYVVEIEPRKPLTLEEKYLPQLKMVPGIEELGPLFKINAPQDLTAPEAEYQVRVVKYVFARHIVVQFECLNTLNCQWLEEVVVRLSYPGHSYKIKSMSQCELRYNEPASVFNVLEFPCALLDSITRIKAYMECYNFACDRFTGKKTVLLPYGEVHELGTIDMECSDQIITRAGEEDFVQQWDRAENVPEVSATYALTQRNVLEAAIKVCEFIGLPQQAIVGDAVKEIRVLGICRGGAPFLLRAKLARGKPEVAMKLAVRSPREDVALLLLAAMY